MAGVTAGLGDALGISGNAGTNSTTSLGSCTTNSTGNWYVSSLHPLHPCLRAYLPSTVYHSTPHAPNPSPRHIPNARSLALSRGTDGNAVGFLRICIGGGVGRGCGVKNCLHLTTERGLDAEGGILDTSTEGGMRRHLTAGWCGLCLGGGRYDMTFTLARYLGYGLER